MAGKRLSRMDRMKDVTKTVTLSKEKSNKVSENGGTTGSPLRLRKPPASTATTRSLQASSSTKRQPNKTTTAVTADNAVTTQNDNKSKKPLAEVQPLQLDFSDPAGENKSSPDAAASGGTSRRAGSNSSRSRIPTLSMSHDSVHSAVEVKSPLNQTSKTSMVSSVSDKSACKLSKLVQLTSRDQVSKTPRLKPVVQEETRAAVKTETVSTGSNLIHHKPAGTSKEQKTNHGHPHSPDRTANCAACCRTQNAESGSNKITTVNATKRKPSTSPTRKPVIASIANKKQPETTKGKPEEPAASKPNNLPVSEFKGSTEKDVCENSAQEGMGEIPLPPAVLAKPEDEQLTHGRMAEVRNEMSGSIRKPRQTSPISTPKRPFTSPDRKHEESKSSVAQKCKPNVDSSKAKSPTRKYFPYGRLRSSERKVPDKQVEVHEVPQPAEDAYVVNDEGSQQVDDADFLIGEGQQPSQNAVAVVDNSAQPLVKIDMLVDEVPQHPENAELIFIQAIKPAPQTLPFVVENLLVSQNCVHPRLEDASETKKSHQKTEHDALVKRHKSQPAVSEDDNVIFRPISSPTLSLCDTMRTVSETLNIQLESKAEKVSVEISVDSEVTKQCDVPLTVSPDEFKPVVHRETSGRIALKDASTQTNNDMKKALSESILFGLASEEITMFDMPGNTKLLQESPPQIQAMNSNPPSRAISQNHLCGENVDVALTLQRALLYLLSRVHCLVEDYIQEQHQQAHALSGKIITPETGDACSPTHSFISPEPSIKSKSSSLNIANLTEIAVATKDAANKLASLVRSERVSPHLSTANTNRETVVPEVSLDLDYGVSLKVEIQPHARAVPTIETNRNGIHVTMASEAVGISDSLCDTVQQIPEVADKIWGADKHDKFPECPRFTIKGTDTECEWISDFRKAAIEKVGVCTSLEQANTTLFQHGDAIFLESFVVNPNKSKIETEDNSLDFEPEQVLVLGSISLTSGEDMPHDDFSTLPDGLGLYMGSVLDEEGISAETEPVLVQSGDENDNFGKDEDTVMEVVVVKEIEILTTAELTQNTSWVENIQASNVNAASGDEKANVCNPNLNTSPLQTEYAPSDDERPTCCIVTDEGEAASNAASDFEWAFSSACDEHESLATDHAFESEELVHAEDETDPFFDNDVYYIPLNGELELEKLFAKFEYQDNEEIPLVIVDNQQEFAHFDLEQEIGHVLIEFEEPIIDSGVETEDESAGICAGSEEAVSDLVIHNLEVERDTPLCDLLAESELTASHIAVVIAPPVCSVLDEEEQAVFDKLPESEPPVYSTVVDSQSGVLDASIKKEPPLCEVVADNEMELRLSEVVAVNIKLGLSSSAVDIQPTFCDVEDEEEQVVFNVLQKDKPTVANELLESETTVVDLAGTLCKIEPGCAEVLAQSEQSQYVPEASAKTVPLHKSEYQLISNEAEADFVPAASLIKETDTEQFTGSIPRVNLSLTVDRFYSRVDPSETPEVSETISKTYEGATHLGQTEVQPSNAAVFYTEGTTAFIQHNDAEVAASKICHQVCNTITDELTDPTAKSNLTLMVPCLPMADDNLNFYKAGNSDNTAVVLNALPECLDNALFGVAAKLEPNLLGGVEFPFSMERELYNGAPHSDISLDAYNDCRNDERLEDGLSPSDHSDMDIISSPAVHQVLCHNGNFGNGRKATIGIHGKLVHSKSDILKGGETRACDIVKNSLNVSLVGNNDKCPSVISLFDFSSFGLTKTLLFLARGAMNPQKARLHEIPSISENSIVKNGCQDIVVQRQTKHYEYVDLFHPGTTVDKERADVRTGNGRVTSTHNHTVHEANDLQEFIDYVLRMETAKLSPWQLELIRNQSRSLRVARSWQQFSLLSIPEEGGNDEDKTMPCCSTDNECWNEADEIYGKLDPSGVECMDENARHIQRLVGVGIEKKPLDIPSNAE